MWQRYAPLKASRFLDGRRTPVFKQAITCARTPRIILIDGTERARLMIAHGVGVTPLAVYELKRVCPAFGCDHVRCLVQMRKRCYRIAPSALFRVFQVFRAEEEAKLTLCLGGSVRRNTRNGWNTLALDTGSLTVRTR